MTTKEITVKDRKAARGCLACPLCNRARKKQKGIAFWLVGFLERGICPNCRAHEKVYGRKAHEPIFPKEIRE